MKQWLLDEFEPLLNSLVLNIKKINSVRNIPFADMAKLQEVWNERKNKIRELEKIFADPYFKSSASPLTGNVSSPLGKNDSDPFSWADKSPFKIRDGPGSPVNKLKAVVISSLYQKIVSRIILTVLGVISTPPSFIKENSYFAFLSSNAIAQEEKKTSEKEISQLVSDFITFRGQYSHAAHFIRVRV